MISKTDIDKQILKLVNYLNSIQNENGSFNGMFFYPSRPEEGWISWGNIPYDTATVLLSLHFTENSSLSLSLIAKSKKFLLSTSLDKLAWRFPPSQGYDPLLYDIDSTAICSYALSLAGTKLHNKSFLNYFINTEHNYLTWMLPKIPSIKFPFKTFIKMYFEGRKALTMNKLNISLTDWEFAINCNVLLYVGKTKENALVWNNLIKDFKNNTIECRYYSKHYSIYSYARLYALGGHNELLISKNLVLNTINELYESLDNETFNLNHLFLLNTILYFKLNFRNYNNLLNLCIFNLKNQANIDPIPYYSSNIIYDKHPDKNEPVNYFGSSALTASLFLEFMNLYKNSIV